MALHTKQIWQAARLLPVDQRFPFLKAAAAQIEDEQERIDFEDAVLCFPNGQEDRSTVVALVHGIRTHAPWQEILTNHIEEENEGVSAYPIGFEFLSLMKFLFWSRREPVSVITAKLRTLQADNPAADLVVVAHSFGTYIISKIICAAPDIRVTRLILCGSIIPTKFFWERVPGLGSHAVLNDVGSRDNWPLLAKQLRCGYGASGTFGFKHPRVRDRYFDYSHSDFLNTSHLAEFWTPFILYGQVVPSPFERTSPSWIRSVLGIVPVRVLLLLIVGCLVFRRLFESWNSYI